MKKTGELIARILNGLLNMVIWMIVAGLLVISGYSLLDNHRLHTQARDESLLMYKPALSSQEAVAQGQIALDGQVAWLCIDGSYIDFPVMQGKSNFEYLNKDPYGEYKLSGSIFLDYRNSSSLTDEFSMIYGHHMDHYSMFGSLDLFAMDVYFDLHKTGWIATKDGIYDLELFAVAWGEADDWTIFAPQGRSVKDVLPYIQEHAVIYTEYIPGTRILALSTCSGETDNSRLIVFGMMKPQDKAALHN